MKKFKFSLFAALAIALALTSAFTTKSGKFATTYKIYGLTKHTYTSPISVANAEGGTLIDNPGSTNETIQDALDNSAANDQCLSDPGFLCAAEVRTIDSPFSKAVTETKEGEYKVTP